MCTIIERLTSPAVDLRNRMAAAPPRSRTWPSSQGISARVTGSSAKPPFRLDPVGGLFVLGGALNILSDPRQRPPSAWQALKRSRLTAPEVRCQRAEARDLLHRMLDNLGKRRPTDDELVAIIGLAQDAFSPESASWRVLSLLAKEVRTSRKVAAA